MQPKFVNVRDNKTNLIIPSSSSASTSQDAMHSFYLMMQLHKNILDLQHGVITDFWCKHTLHCSGSALSHRQQCSGFGQHELLWGNHCLHLLLLRLGVRIFATNVHPASANDDHFCIIMFFWEVIIIITWNITWTHIHTEICGMVTLTKKTW